MILLLENNFLLVVNVILVALFALYLRRKWKEEEFRLEGARVFRSDRTKVAWGLALGYCAKMIDRFGALLDAHDVSIARYPLRAAGLALAVWSAACILTVFAGVAWGRRAWAWCLLVSAAASALLTWAWALPT